MRSKRWAFFAVVLIALGVILFCIAGIQCQWDFSKLTTANYTTNIHTVQDSFRNISIDTNTADVRILPSLDGVCRVECFEETYRRHAVEVESDTLTIQMVDERKWYEYIAFHLKSTHVVLYLPLETYDSLTINGSTGDISVPEDFTFAHVDIRLSTGDLSFSASASGGIQIESSTGDIRIENNSAETMNISASTGSISMSNVICTRDIRLRLTTGSAELSNVLCTELASTGDTGDIRMENVTATQSIHIERSTGDVLFERCDSEDTYIQTDTGCVKGSFLSDKIFHANSDTGDVDIPKSQTGGYCEIITDTGDIKIAIAQP